MTRAAGAVVAVQAYVWSEELLTDDVNALTVPEKGAEMGPVVDVVESESVVA